MINSINDDNHRFEIIQRFEHDDVNFQCDLMDVAWWKRPNLLATRFNVILPRFRSKVSLKLTNDNENLQTLTIRELRSNDSGVYECETLGAIRQFSLIVMGKFPLFSFVIIFISLEILCQVKYR
ncbi:unnamed protein product [Rotaria socialis]|uniref:Immunoglobulin domain-containing protein n=1 Tax=Rotaria socialis TaxID=392032 RepID=A0A821N357_9BILA|nr:unnamed protein product [Rotaria socialis]